MIETGRFNPFELSLFSAEVSELADELDSGSSGSFCRVGSSPIFRIGYFVPDRLQNAGGSVFIMPLIFEHS